MSGEEVIVIGAGISGYCCATILARSNVNVLLIDSDELRNSSPDIVTHNLLTRDGVNKSEILKQARADYLRYKSASITYGTVNSLKKNQEKYEVNVVSGKIFSSKYIVVATGANYSDEILNVPGATELWGKEIFNCPYCHMFEYTNKKVAIIKNLEGAKFYKELLKQWTDNTVIITNNNNLLNLSRNEKGIYFNKIVKFQKSENNIISISMNGRKKLYVDAIFCPGMKQNKNELLRKIGAEFYKEPNRSHLPATNNESETSFTNIFVIGDSRTGFSNLTGAPYEAMVVATSIVGRLVSDRYEKLDIK